MIALPKRAEMDDTRTYNLRGELTGRSYNDYSHSPATPSLTYDLNGNLTDDGEKYEYIYNAWGQLVQIEDQSSKLVAVYTYNGLGQRISEKTDTNDSGNSGIPDTDVDSYDPIFFIAVDQQGRRVATFRGTDQYPKETFAYHPDGVRGPGFPGGILLRDRNSNLSSPKNWASAAAGSTRSERNYYCSDFRGNVVALVNAAGKLVEQYRYSASGVPFGIPLGNVKSDGTVDATNSGTTDFTIADYIKANVYEPRADLDLDGAVDSADLAIITAQDGVSTGRGKLSVASVFSSRGYGGSSHYFSGLYGVHFSDPVNAGLDQNLVRFVGPDRDGLNGPPADMVVGGSAVHPTTPGQILLTGMASLTIGEQILALCLIGLGAQTIADMLGVDVRMVSCTEVLSIPRRLPRLRRFDPIDLVLRPRPIDIAFPVDRRPWPDVTDRSVQCLIYAAEAELACLNGGNPPSMCEILGETVYEMCMAGQAPGWRPPRVSDWP